MLAALSEPDNTPTKGILVDMSGAGFLKSGCKELRALIDLDLRTSEGLVSVYFMHKYSIIGIFLKAHIKIF